MDDIYKGKTKEQQIELVYDLTLQNLSGRETDLEIYRLGIEACYNELIENLNISTRLKTECNTLPLHLERKKCPSCSQYFTTQNKLQECCTSNCRVKLFRVRNRLNNFSKKVEKILRGKFVIEQIISDSKSCPFVVHYDGKQYQSSSTRNLLNQLKKCS